MPRFPQRKTLLALVILGGLAAGGCASRTQTASTSAVPVKESSQTSAPLTSRTRSLPAPPPELKPTTPRVMEFTPPPDRPLTGWTFRKSEAKGSELSLFEEAVLIGQVRGTLKQIPAGAEVKSTQLKNRTAVLVVSSKVDTAMARDISDALLKLKSLEEVRLTPGS